LNGLRAQAFVIVGALGQFVSRHQSVECRDIVGNHRGEPQPQALRLAAKREKFRFERLQSLLAKADIAHHGDECRARRAHDRGRTAAAGRRRVAREALEEFLERG
jgi:hypothetical protein